MSTWEPTTNDELATEQANMLEALYNTIGDIDSATASAIVYDERERYIGSVSVTRVDPGVWVGVAIKAVPDKDVSIIIASRKS